jgi:E3 Ubiquitin ligase
MGLAFAVLAGVGVLVVAGAAMLSPERRLRRALARAQQATVADAPEGVPVCLVGVVAADELLEAPLSRRACVYYELEILAVTGPSRMPSRRLDTRRPERAREQRAIGFALDDGTGRALVDPKGARVTVRPSARDMSEGSPDEPMRSLLRQHGMRSRQNLFRERVLVPGQRVMIRGVAVREPDPEGAARATGYRGDSPTRLRLAGTPKAPLLIAEVGAEAVD